MGFIFVFVFEDFDEVGRLEDPVEIGRPVFIVFAVEEIGLAGKLENEPELFFAEFGEAGGKQFFAGIGLDHDPGEVWAGGMKKFKKF